MRLLRCFLLCSLVAASAFAQPTRPFSNESAFGARAAPIGLPWEPSATSPDDDRWSDAFALPYGVDGVLDAVALAPNGDVYVGGLLNVAGGVFADGVARWDGEQWRALSEGLAGFYVEDLALDGEGTLYAVGRMDTPYPRDAVKRWDGTEWETIGRVFGAIGTGGSPFAASIDSEGRLLVGGSFEVMEGEATAGVAVWDGKSWSGLGEGVAGEVYAVLPTDDGVLYVGGELSGLSGGPLRWDGSEWQPLVGSDGSEITGGRVYDLALGPDGTLYAGGEFSSTMDTDPGDRVLGNVAAWDGERWELLLESHDRVFALALDKDGSLVAAGLLWEGAGTDDLAPAHEILRWDGAAWEPIGSVPSSPAVSPVLAMEAGPEGELYAVSGFDAISGQAVYGVGRWDGEAWSGIGTGEGEGGAFYVHALLADGSGGVYAGGAFTAIGSQATSGFAYWDGEMWSGLGEAEQVFIKDLAAAPGGGLYAGGSNIGLGGESYNVARWDGTAWEPFPLIVGGGEPYRINAVAVAPDGTLYAGGRCGHAGTDDPYNGIVRWDGEAWAPLQSGLTVSGGICGEVTALVVADDGILYVGGRFEEAGGKPASYVARWDGTAWSPVGDNLDGPGQRLRDLFIASDGALYAVGGFYSGNSVLRLDGSSWEAVEGLPGGSGSSLAEDAAGRLYVRGGFSDGSEVLQQDGDTWRRLGSGLNRWTRALAFEPTTGGLFVAGAFYGAGGKVSVDIARWDTRGSVSNEPGGDPDALALAPAFPNPFTSSTALSFTLPEVGRARLAVYDVLGREVAVLAEAPHAAGEHTVTWRPDDLASGVYLVRLEAGGAAATRRVLLLR